jgi:hypothetical protein
MQNTQTFDRNKLIAILYFSIPFVLFLFQYTLTSSSVNQIRYEEIAESIRNVFWFNKGLIYDGVSSNVGWYAILSGVYYFFGFSLFTAKFFRLFLYLFSILSLAILLKKYSSYKKAFLPLITIGLSPTFLYLNTLQAQFGFDLQVLPIITLLIDSIKLNHKLKAFVLQFTAWFFSALAIMSYPTFFYYLFPLTFYYFLIIKRQVKNNTYILKNLILSAFSFLLPITIIFIYLKNRSLLVFDPIVKSGIFRGSGKIFFDLDYIYKNVFNLAQDLFIKGESYYFNLASSDFSGFYPIISVLTVLMLSILISRKRKMSIFIFFAFFVIISTLIISSLTFDPSNSPGIRRNTSILASFYFLFCISWFYVLSKNWKEVSLKYLVIIIFALIPMHHLLVYSTNLENIANKSPNQYALWFNAKESPQESLDLFINKIQTEDLELSCTDSSGKSTYCRYNEIYSAILISCHFNHLNCKNILGYDLKTESFIPISTELWQNYYWEH